MPTLQKRLALVTKPVAGSRAADFVNICLTLAGSAYGRRSTATPLSPLGCTLPATSVSCRRRQPMEFTEDKLKVLLERAEVKPTPEDWEVLVKWMPRYFERLSKF